MPPQTAAISPNTRSSQPRCPATGPVLRTPVISYASIYRFIYAQLARTKDYSRLLLAWRPGSKAAEPIGAEPVRILSPLPTELRRSVTFDNGTEFARRYRQHAKGIQTYFCDVKSPWQKGGVENAMGRRRRFLPRPTDLKCESTFRLKPE